MGNRGVSAPLPLDGGSGGKTAPIFTYSEKFNEVFPYYLAIGMSYDEFWNMDCTLVKHYQKAFEIKRDIQNQNMWLQGMYIYEALCCVSPVLQAFAKKGTAPMPNRSEPYQFENSAKNTDIGEKSKEQKEFERLKVSMEMFMVNHNAKFKEKGELSDGG